MGDSLPPPLPPPPPLPHLHSLPLPSSPLSPSPLRPLPSGFCAPTLPATGPCPHFPGSPGLLSKMVLRTIWTRARGAGAPLQCCSGARRLPGPCAPPPPHLLLPRWRPSVHPGLLCRERPRCSGAAWWPGRTRAPAQAGSLPALNPVSHCVQPGGRRVASCRPNRSREVGQQPAWGEGRAPSLGTDPGSPVSSMLGSPADAVPTLLCSVRRPGVCEHAPRPQEQQLTIGTLMGTLSGEPPSKGCPSRSPAPTQCPSSLRVSAPGPVPPPLPP